MNIYKLYVGCDMITPLLLRELTRIQESGQMVRVEDSFYLLIQAQAAYITKYQADASAMDKTHLEAVVNKLGDYGLEWVLYPDLLTQYCAEYLQSIGCECLPGGKLWGTANAAHVAGADHVFLRSILVSPTSDDMSDIIVEH